MNDLLTMDLDSRKITLLLLTGKGGNFVLSPDGSLIAVQGDGHIDIVSIDGQMVHKDLVNYVPTRPYVLNPRMFWTSDSAELIVSLPVGRVADLSGPEILSIWRFAIDGSEKNRDKP